MGQKEGLGDLEPDGLVCVVQKLLINLDFYIQLLYLYYLKKTVQNLE